MFSGIIEEVGQVKSITRKSASLVLEIGVSLALTGAAIGESIAVNGVCLTVVKKLPQSLCFDLLPETKRVTNLGILKNRDHVNLERSLRMGERISGHFVTGHVDCLGVVRKKRRIDGSLSFEVAVPPESRAQLLPKGSVAVDGVSLTIVEISGNLFSVQIIPHTAANTTLGKKGPADKLNIEFDILAKKAAVGRAF
jgi:riboflavin synthase